MRRDFQLIDSIWEEHLLSASEAPGRELRIICPFIKKGTIERLLAATRPKRVRVITRYNLDNFVAGVSDIDALRLLMKHKAEIRGVRGLHAKVYLFGAPPTRAVVTSANLTDAAMMTNHEFGFYAEQQLVVKRCAEYFEEFWKLCTFDLKPEKLDEWETKVGKQRAELKSRGALKQLGDEGEVIRLSSNKSASARRLEDAPQVYVKFFGVSGKRSNRSRPILEEIDASGSHWACTYPKGKRPSSVRDGDIIFIGCMVPGDILVYGQAVALAHKRGEDDATPDDIKRRTWKETWPHYVRIHSPQFVRGTLANGVSLNELKKELGADAFASTQEHKIRGEGNQDPDRAYLRQAAVRLSPDGAVWMADHLHDAFILHGRVTPAELAKLDKPGKPGTPR